MEQYQLMVLLRKLVVSLEVPHIFLDHSTCFHYSKSLEYFKSLVRVSVTQTVGEFLHPNKSERPTTPTYNHYHSKSQRTSRL